MKYSVATFRAVGMLARWTKTRNGAPIVAVRHNEHKAWYVVDRYMWADMQKEGIKEAYERYTLLGDIFSVPA